jgi:DNA repair protein RadC
MSNSSNKVSEIRLYYKPKKQVLYPIIKDAQTAYNALLSFYPKGTLALQEQFVILYLNRSNAVLGGYQCSKGGLTGTIADIRLILGVALKAGSTNIIISHNHPSGNIKPSSQDIEMTKRLSEAAKIMEINVLDHIIVSPDPSSFYSFADHGQI